MHICHIITRLIVGGAQENTLLTCEGLHARGHEVTLIAGPAHGPEGSLVERARAGGYRFIEIWELIRGINPWVDARAVRTLSDILTNLRPDIVHTHSSKAGIVGRMAAYRARTPIIIHTIHGMSFNRTQRAFVRTAYAWLERRCARHTDRIITVADAMIEQSVAARIAPRERFVTVYSGMDVSAFTPSAVRRAAARARWGIPESSDTVVVGTVARLFRNKGYEQLIPAMVLAAQAEPRLRFVWVGDGAQRAEYQHALTSAGIAERVTLTGLVRPERVADEVAGFDILAHASRWEGLPRAVVQGLLMQVPAVAVNLDGTPEVVIDGVTGRLVQPDDVEELAGALVDLAQDAAGRQKMGQAGREHCLERFDARRMVERLEQVYEQAAAREIGARRR